ncbi:MAG: J domain-containing protein [Clostridia bacterium]|nr:J domain-containing protein [Clostridia bacterium]
MAKNPYTVLGVSENATDEEIRAAYRRLAKQYHPDLNPNDAAAAAKMNDVNVAYDQIKTAEKRAAYREASQQQSYHQQHGYGADPFQSYYQSGHGYYGGSYTGGNQNDGNEPPFGWSSVFEEEQQRRTVNPYRMRVLRLLLLFLFFTVILMFTRCVLNGCLYTCYYPLFGSVDSETVLDQAESKELFVVGDQHELS